MILSQTTYRWADASLERQRAIAPSWIIKRVRTRGLLDDERPLSTLGRETTSSRARLGILLQGQGAAFADNRAWPVATGDAIYMAPLATVYGVDITPSTWLEIDWDIAPQPPEIQRVAVGGRLVGAAREVAGRLSDPETPFVAIALSIRTLFDALGAEGFGPFDTRPLDGIDLPSQLALQAVDGVLADLQAQPQVVDLEARLSCSRWTLGRSIRGLSQKYGLSGVSGGTDWRSMRDFMRLRVAGIFMSHPQAATGVIARRVGYRSAEAMCHAFANAGLPSPGRLRSLRLASL